MFVVLFVLLGIITFLFTGKTNKAPSVNTSKNSIKDTQGIGKNYRGYKLNAFGQFGERDARTGERYIVATEDEALIMFEKLTQDWGTVINADGGAKKEVGGVLEKEKSEWNVIARYIIVPEEQRSESLYPHNSLLSISFLDKNKTGTGCPFNANQIIRFYTTKEAYEEANNNTRQKTESSKKLDAMKKGNL